MKKTTSPVITTLSYVPSPLRKRVGSLFSENVIDLILAVIVLAALLISLKILSTDIVFNHIFPF